MNMLSKTLAVFLILPLLFAGSAQAGIGLTNVEVPFTDTVFVSSTNEWVNVRGTLHVVVQVATPSGSCTTADPCSDVPITIHSNLHDVTAVGATSGKSYQAFGAVSTDVNEALPGSFTIPNNFTMSTPEGDLIEYALVVALIAFAATVDVHVLTGGQ